MGLTVGALRTRLALGTLVLFALRLALSAIRSGPVLVADEIGYLGNARVLAGGIDAQLHLAPFYRGGYSLLIAPLIELGASQAATYHLILALNAALVAAVFPLLYLLLSRFLGFDSGLAMLAAFAGAFYPALTVLPQVAMSENALFPLVCLWLIAIAGLLAAEGGGTVPWGAGLGAATAALWVVHNRAIAAVALTVLLVLGLGLRRRLTPAAVVATLALLALGIWGTHLLDAHLIDANYASAAEDEASQRLDQLLTADGLGNAVLNLFGQLWYLLAATFGLAAVVAADLFRRLREREPISPALLTTASLLALTTLLLLVSAAAFPERTRPDMLVYGRYVEIVAPALIAIGLATLASRRLALPPRLAAAGFAALTALVVAIRVLASDPGAPNRWNISALPFLTGQLGAAIIVGAATIALAGAWLLTRTATRRPGATALVALALFAPIAVYGAWNPVRSSQIAVYPDGWSSPEPVASRYGVTRAAYDLSEYDPIGLFATQWFLPDTSIPLFESRRRDAPTRFVIASTDWGEAHPRYGAKRLWTEVGRDQALWRVSRPRR